MHVLTMRLPYLYWGGALYFPWRATVAGKENGGGCHMSPCMVDSGWLEGGVSRKRFPQAVDKSAVSAVRLQKINAQLTQLPAA